MPYIHDLNPIALHVFGWPVYWYGLAYMVGFLFCRYWLPRCYGESVAMEKKIAGARVQGLAPTNAPPLTAHHWDNFLLYGILATLVGGRLGFVLLYHGDYFFSLPPQQWWQWLAVWHGGMAFHGAAVGLFVASILFCRRHNINPWLFVDNFTRAVPVALLVGRLANFVNGELIGRPITNVFWQNKIGVVFPAVDNLPRYPSQLVEGFFEGLVLFLLLHLLASYKNRRAMNIINAMTAKKLRARAVPHGLSHGLPHSLPHGVVFCGFLFFTVCSDFLSNFCANQPTVTSAR